MEHWEGEASGRARLLPSRSAVFGSAEASPSRSQLALPFASPAFERSSAGSSMLFNQYYSDVHVRARLIEFLGGSSLDDATSVYVTGDGRGSHVWYEPRPVQQLWQCVAEGQEVGRSLWDRRSLIGHLDIEYVNFDFPAEPYLEPTRCFGIQQPVVRAIRDVLREHHIDALHMLSGRGHHFVWQVARDSPACVRLARLGRVPETLAARYACAQRPTGEVIPPELGAAFAGLALVLEFVAHCALATCADQCEIPVELTAVEAGPGRRGREIVSIDLSEYGDPLHVRSIRLPFSTYLKPQQQRAVLGDDVVEQLAPLFVIPWDEMDSQQGVLAMRNMDEVKKLASHVSARIPDQSQGMESLIAAYGGSKLARFHDFFYAAEHDLPDAWPGTYDRTPLEALPPCAARILQQPNDLSLKPAGIQHLVRILSAVGWHPRHIAGLIRSKYERDFGWGDQWYIYDAATRADFYARLFGGLFAAGRDELVDFNCRSTQEKGYCPPGECSINLDDYRRALLKKRNGMTCTEASHD
jgi:hypothetical protein